MKIPKHLFWFVSGIMTAQIRNGLLRIPFKGHALFDSFKYDSIVTVPLSKIQAIEHTDRFIQIRVNSSLSYQCYYDSKQEAEQQFNIWEKALEQISVPDKPEVKSAYHEGPAPDPWALEQMM